MISFASAISALPFRWSLRKGPLTEMITTGSWVQKWCNVDTEMRNNYSAMTHKVIFFFQMSLAQCYWCDEIEQRGRQCLRDATTRTHMHNDMLCRALCLTLVELPSPWTMHCWVRNTPICLHLFSLQRTQTHTHTHLRTCILWVIDVSLQRNFFRGNSVPCNLTSPPPTTVFSAWSCGSPLPGWKITWTCVCASAFTFLLGRGGISQPAWHTLH